MLEISAADIAAKLKADNPWWSAPPDTPWPVTALPRRAQFGSFWQLVTSPVRRAVVLLGARRVGKTTMIRQAIAEAIAGGNLLGPILFASIDTPTYAGLPLERLLQVFEAEHPHDPAARRLVVFDEIQYLRDWERHLKDLVDRHPATKFVVSGSAGAALRRQSEESGAGRFTDFELSSLSFAEYLAFAGKEDALIEATGPAPREYRARDLAALNQAFIDYVNSGGYPEMVVDSAARADPQRFSGRDIVDKVLLRDLPQLYGIQDIQELNRLFTAVTYNTGQEVSLEELSKNSGVAKNTIARYLDYLESAFLIARVRRVDENARHFQRQRQIKVYLTNPSMRAALFGPVVDATPAMGALAETAAFCQWLPSPARRQLHYARWPQGELDIVCLDPGMQRPVWAYDVKWSDNHVERPGELKRAVEFAQRVGLKMIGATTKTLTRTDRIGGIEVRMFPLSLHCYRVGKAQDEHCAWELDP
jgi:predicted AAA+ superfamily ATPase